MRRTTTTWPRASRGPNRVRRYIKVAVATLAVMALHFGTSPASAQQSADGILPPGEWSQAQVDWTVNWIRQNEQVLPQKFSNVNDLAAMGFVDIGPLTAGYAHYVNTSWMVDGHILNPEYPESLVYRVMPNGTRQVQAAMYFLWPEARVETVPPLISWLPGWHAHPELCSDDQGRIRGVNLGSGCPAGTHQVLNPMVHAWITDPGCGHRFGGLGVGGLHCDYDHEHDH